MAWHARAGICRGEHEVVPIGAAVTLKHGHEGDDFGDAHLRKAGDAQLPIRPVRQKLRDRLECFTFHVDEPQRELVA